MDITFHLEPTADTPPHRPLPYLTRITTAEQFLLPSSGTFATLYNHLYGLIYQRLLRSVVLRIYTSTGVLLLANATPLSALMEDYASPHGVVDLRYEYGIPTRAAEVFGRGDGSGGGGCNGGV